MKPEDLLQPIPGDDPAGTECVYDLDFLKITELADLLAVRAEAEELRRLARGPFDGDNAKSDSAMAASELQSAEDRGRMLAGRVREAFGKDVEGNRLPAELEALSATMLRTRGKDLRVILPLTLACMRARGLPGLLQGLAVFEGALRGFPEGVHPRPDDDPQDDSSRSMVFAELLSGAAACSILRETVLVSNRAGRLSFRDAEVLDGVLPADPGGQSLSGDEHFRAVIRHDIAARDGVEVDRVSTEALRERLRVMHTELNAAEDTLRRIGAGFRHKAGGTPRLTQLLGRMTARVGRHFDELVASDAMAQVDRLVSAPPPPGPTATAASATGRTAAPATAAPAARPVNREQIRLQVLDLAAQLEQIEPSHPAPLFLRRAARLLSAKSFFDIVTDMVPDAMSQVETLTGKSRPEA